MCHRENETSATNNISAQHNLSSDTALHARLSELVNKDFLQIHVGCKPPCMWTSLALSFRLPKSSRRIWWQVDLLICRTSASMRTITVRYFLIMSLLRTTLFVPWTRKAGLILCHSPPTPYPRRIACATETLAPEMKLHRQRHNEEAAMALWLSSPASHRIWC
jgi:hypothetical protein